MGDKKAVVKEHWVSGGKDYYAVKYEDDKGEHKVLQKGKGSDYEGHVTIHPDSYHKHGSYADEDDKKK